MSRYRPRYVTFRHYFHGPLGKGRMVLAVMAVVGAVSLVGAGLETLFVANEHRNFVKIPCFMETATVHRESGRDDRFLPAYHYVPTVKYRYEYNGQVFTGNVVSSRVTPMVGKFGADEFLLKYGPGMMTTCYVDPKEPDDAMLMLPHDNNGPLWAKVGGLLLCLSFGGFVVLHYVTMIDTRPPQKQPRAPGWGEIDSGPNDALSRTRGILREHLES
ncbi:hypothetical protein BH11PLA2_BH11PLA2_11100 [soil metagenome]